MMSQLIKAWTAKPRHYITNIVAMARYGQFSSGVPDGKPSKADEMLQDLE
jgi:hypothetical protein